MDGWSFEPWPRSPQFGEKIPAKSASYAESPSAEVWSIRRGRVGDSPIEGDTAVTGLEMALNGQGGAVFLRISFPVFLALAGGWPRNSRIIYRSMN